MKKKGKRRRRRRKNDISLLSNAPFPFASGLGRLSSLFSRRPRKRRRRSREGQSLLRTSRPAIERIRRQLHRRWRRATSLSFLDLSSVYRRLNSPLDPAQLAKRQGGTRFKCLDAKRERSGGEPRCDSCRGRASENEKMKGKKLETPLFLGFRRQKTQRFRSASFARCSVPNLRVRPSAGESLCRICAAAEAREKRERRERRRELGRSKRRDSSQNQSHPHLPPPPPLSSGQLS